MKPWSIFNCLFSFSGWREEQRFVLNRFGAGLQVFTSCSNIRGVADITEMIATGKRSQVARLVCEPSLLILSLVTYRILEKDLVLEMFSWHWVGSHLPVEGLWLRFQVAGYMKLVGGELACKNSHLSLLLATWYVLQGGTSGTLQQKFHTDEEYIPQVLPVFL